MANVLDRSQEEVVAGILLENQEELGYVPEEFIPGLMVAARSLAANSGASDQVLDEAVQILGEEQEEA